VPTVISGDANEIAVASASGSRASAAKLRNIPTRADEASADMTERSMKCENAVRNWP